MGNFMGRRKGDMAARAGAAGKREAEESRLERLDGGVCISRP